MNLKDSLLFFIVKEIAIIFGLMVIFIFVISAPSIFNAEFAVRRMYLNFLGDFAEVIISVLVICGIVAGSIEIIKKFSYKSKEKVNVPITIFSIICGSIIAVLLVCISVPDMYNIAVDYKTQDTKFIKIDNIRTEKRRKGKSENYYLIGSINESKEEKEFNIDYPISEEIEWYKSHGIHSVKVEYYWRSNTFRKYIIN